jgi:hypothetical protein
MGYQKRHDQLYIPSDTRTADEVKIVMESKIIAAASESFQMRRRSTSHYPRVFILLEFDDLFQEKPQNE